MTKGSAPRDSDWWKSAVVYQIYPRSFADSDGDGIGDLRGIIGRLDHLAELGVDVLWLSPIYPSPQIDNGYDVADYQAIDPLFGTLDDFDELVAQAHARGLKIVLDIVVNHTSDQHPWFLESRSGPASPKRDWYWWRPPAATTGGPPTNWGSYFGGSAWQLDPASGEYYLHLFAPEQPDLNWENPQVRSAVHAMMRWWLARGVDGFRLDVINLIAKDPALPDGVIDPRTGFANGEPHYANGPRIHEYLAEMRREVFQGNDSGRILIGEMLSVGVADAARYTDPGRGELDMVFQFEHVVLDHGSHKFDRIPVELPRLKASLNHWQEHLGPRGWNTLYLSNHDQPRPVSRFGNDRAFRVESATAIATTLHLMRGTPFVYQGEELGMANPPLTELGDLRDIESINYARQALTAGEDPETVWHAIRTGSRDNARSPMQWDASAHAGFTTGVPWFPVNPDHDRVNADRQRRDADSVFAHYRRLIELRHRNPVVVRGDFTSLYPEHPALFAYRRSWGGETLTVIANWSDRPVPIPADLRQRDQSLVLANDGTDEAAETLGPWAVRVFAGSIAGNPDRV